MVAKSLTNVRETFHMPQNDLKCVFVVGDSICCAAFITLFLTCNPPSSSIFHRYSIWFCIKKHLFNRVLGHPVGGALILGLCARCVRRRCSQRWLCCPSKTYRSSIYMPTTWRRLLVGMSLVRYVGRNSFVQIGTFPGGPQNWSYVCPSRVFWFSSMPCFSLEWRIRMRFRVIRRTGPSWALDMILLFSSH